MSFPKGSSLSIILVCVLSLVQPPTSASNINPHSHRRLSPCGPGHRVGRKEGAASVKSRFWSLSSSSAADQIVEFFSRSHSVLRRDARRARRGLVECSPTSENITLDPQPCYNHCLRNPRWCPFHCIMGVSLSLDRVSHSFPHSSALFNSLPRYAVAILPRSVVAPPMLCHHSTR